jgi:hypothetical protein
VVDAQAERKSRRLGPGNSVGPPGSLKRLGTPREVPGEIAIKLAIRLSPIIRCYILTQMAHVQQDLRASEWLD